MLDAGAGHRTGGEGMALYDDWRLRQNGLDIQRPQPALIQGRAKIRKATIGTEVESAAEIVFPAGTKTQILAHARTVYLQEPEKPADMVGMSMAYEQRIDRADIDLQEIEVVGVDVRRETEVKEITPRLLTPTRFEMQRQAHSLSSVLPSGPPGFGR